MNTLKNFSVREASFAVPTMNGMRCVNRGHSSEAHYAGDGSRRSIEPRLRKDTGRGSLEAVSALCAIAIAISIALCSTARVSAHTKHAGEVAISMKNSK